MNSGLHNAPSAGLIAALVQCERERVQVVSGRNGRAALTQIEAVTLADEIEALRAELERQQALWTTQSQVITALAAEVPDDVRARVLSPIFERPQAGG